MKHKLRMNAYYYSFTPTGLELVDRILSAVACAGKGYHHTEDWNEEDDWRDTNCPPFRGKSYVDWIQNAADDAANGFRRLAEAATQYMQHKSDCPMEIPPTFRHDWEKCNCGLSDVLDLLRSLEGQGQKEIQSRGDRKC